MMKLQKDYCLAKLRDCSVMGGWKNHRRESGCVLADRDVLMPRNSAECGDDCDFSAPLQSQFSAH